jgi:hypothetical protein
MSAHGDTPRRMWVNQAQYPGDKAFTQDMPDDAIGRIKRKDESGACPTVDQVGLKYDIRWKRAETFGRVVVAEKSIVLIFIFSFLEALMFERLYP